MKTCPRCGLSVPDDAKFCPKDGYRYPLQKGILLPLMGFVSNRVIAILVGILLAGTIIFIIVQSSHSGTTLTPPVNYTPTDVLLPTTMPASTSTKAFHPTATDNYPTSQPLHSYANISYEISYAAIRRSEGYVSKDDSVDIIAKVPAGETVEIIGGPNHTDNLVWWYVTWQGYKGWMSDHTASGKTIMIFFPSSGSSPMPSKSPSGTWTACPDALPSRLHVGDLAMVSLSNGLANHLRTGYGTSNPVIAHLDPGVRMRILDGPACNHKMVWWYVQTIDVSYSPGWTSEGDSDYWLDPIQP